MGIDGRGPRLNILDGRVLTSRVVQFVTSESVPG